MSSELSPTDGFFNRPVASNAMVPDPSLDRKDAVAEDKVLIPRSEARMGSGGPSRSTTSPTLEQLFPSQSYASSQSNNHPAPSATSNTASSPVSHRQTTDEFFSRSRHPMRGPPPAYTPPSPTTSSHPNHNRSYNTLAQQIEQGVPSHTEPQSMGRPEDNPDERTPLSQNGVRKRSYHRRRTWKRKALFVAFVFAVVIGIMMTLINWASVCAQLSSA